MCDFSGRLIAWLDGELAEREATAVERHFASCAECRARLSSYQDASDAFSAYCDSAVNAAIERPLDTSVRRWALGTAAVAAVALLMLALVWHPAIPRAVTIDRVASRGVMSPRSVPQTSSVSQKAAISSSESTVHRSPRIEPVRRTRALAESAKQHSLEPASVDPADSVAVVPAIEIALPADGMFPPGAMPEGMTFMASVTIAAGEPETRGELAGFERRK